MLIILKLRSFSFVFVGDGKLFLKLSQILVVCICYCYNFHIFLSFASESRVARNTILIQRDVLWTASICLVGTIGNDCVQEYFPEIEKDALWPVGSWTTFMKSVTDCHSTTIRVSSRDSIASR